MDAGGKDNDGKMVETPPASGPGKVRPAAPGDEVVERLRLLGVELLSSLHESAFLHIRREKQAKVLNELSGQARALIDMASCFGEMGEDDNAPESVLTQQFLSLLRKRFDSRASARSLTFQIHFSTPFPVKTVFHRHGFATLVNLLIENSFRQTDSGKISLQLGYDEQEGKVLFVVNNSGAGVSKEKLEKDYNEGKFALEMLGALEMADRLDGNFEVHSLEGIGTSYRGSCPVHFASEDRLTWVPEEEEPVQEGHSACIDTASMTGALLVYEQSYLFSEILASWLNKTSLDVTYARDFEADRNLPMSRRYQLVLVDTTGRWQESCLFVQRIRAMGVEVPFMALVLDQSVEESIESGFDFIVRVPCDEIKFLRILSCLFRTAEAMRESAERLVKSRSKKRLDPAPQKRSSENEESEARQIQDIVSETPAVLPLLAEFLDDFDSELADVESAVRSGEMDRGRKLVEDFRSAAEMLGLSLLSQAAGTLASAVAFEGIEEIGRAFKKVRSIAHLMISALDDISPSSTDGSEEGKPAALKVHDRAVLADNAREFINCISDFLICLKEDVKQLKLLLESRNWNRLQFLANQLRGTAAFYGFDKHAQELLEIENAAKASDYDSASAALTGLECLGEEENRPPAEVGKEPPGTDPVSPHVEEAAGSNENRKESASAKKHSVDLPEHEMIASELMGSSPELVPLIVEFLGSLDEYMDRITNAANELAWSKLRTVAHELAGVSSMYGYPLCARTAKSLQAAAEASCAAELDPLIMKLRAIAGGMKKGASALH